MKIVLDIETVQPTREEWSRLVGKPVTGDQLSTDDCMDLFSAAAADDSGGPMMNCIPSVPSTGPYSRIVCIGVIELSDSLEPRDLMLGMEAMSGNCCVCFGVIWDKFARHCSSPITDSASICPFIKKRSVIHQVKPALEINLARFRVEPVYDTMAVWSNWDNRGWVKLDVLARALNVETKSGSGSQVGAMWEQGLGREIGLYCLQDTYVTYACYCRMIFRQPCPGRWFC